MECDIESVARKEFIVMSGKVVAERIKEKIRDEAVRVLREFGHMARLAIILVGDRPDSLMYINQKEKFCKQCGIECILHRFHSDQDADGLRELVSSLNKDPTISGILLQLPLPGHLDAQELVEHIDPRKDVDGLHPVNVGKLAIKGQTSFFHPCTAVGIMEILQFYGVNIHGSDVCVVGRSNIVGKPICLLMEKANATVTVCHSHTVNLCSYIRRADIIVVAIGIPEFIQPEWIKYGCVIVDVGINLINDASTKSGQRVVGDVDFEKCAKKASAITPVPGGCGPMTVAILARNTVVALQYLHKNVQINLTRPGFIR